MAVFYVVDTYGSGYLCYGTNFHMAGANPTIQLLLYSLEEECWMVDDAAKYTPAKDIKEW